MELQVNGETREMSDNLSVTGLLEELGYGDKRVAVERNGELVPKSLHAEVTVNDGDRIEIVQAIGGG